MVDYFKNIGNAESHIKAGIGFSVGLTATSLAVPIVEAIAGKLDIKISLFDWLLVFLVGLSSFFFFMGVWFNANVNTQIKQEGDKKIRATYTDLPLAKWNPLSKGCFCVAGILGILAVIRIIILFFK